MDQNFALNKDQNIATLCCGRCPNTAGLRVVVPRVPGTAGRFMAAELLCRECCQKIRGEFRLSRTDVADFVRRRLEGK